MWKDSVPRLDASSGLNVSQWNEISPEDSERELPSFPSPGVVPPPRSLLKVEKAEVTAGDELSFDDMFENGARKNSFDHRRSCSVMSLDDIPENQEAHSLEHVASSSLLIKVHSCTIQEELDPVMDPTEPKLCPSDFELLAVIGQGAFGKVFQVKKKDTGTVYAMKVMKKESILEKDHAQYVWSERDCLTSLDHPYIVKLYYSFQTKHKLYMILEFLTGGHLFYQLYQKGCFTEEQTRIYAAELVSAVSFLHSRGIIHRDLKPENVLLDADGHVKVTDFGLSKGDIEDSQTRASSFVGTLQYMAPEIIQGKQHTTAVDWWSIGILIYEMIHGEPPFDYPSQKRDVTEKDRRKLMGRITSAKIQKPRYCSEQAWSLMQRLLCRNSVERQRNGETIRSHPFFKKVKWEDIESRCTAPPFCPESKSQTSNVDKRYRHMPAVDSPCTTPSHPNAFHAFQGYSYTKPSALRKSRDGLDCF